MFDLKTCVENEILECFGIDNQDDIECRNILSAYNKGRADAIDEFVEYIKQYMWWSTQADEKIIGEFALEEYASVFKNKLNKK